MKPTIEIVTRITMTFQIFFVVFWFMASYFANGTKR